VRAGCDDPPVSLGLLYDASVNVVDLFARHNPDAVAFVCEAESQTYGELTERVALARTEFALRVAKASNIVVIGESSIAFIETLFAALSAGLPVVPLHPRYPRGEVERAVELARPALIVSTDDASVVLAEGLGVDHLHASELFVDTVDPIEPVVLEPDHPALLMFTSGTAGSPRIAVLSHGNVAAAIQSSRDSSPSVSDEHHTILGVMPLTHVLGIVSVVAVAITVGATVVLTTKVDVESVAQSVQENQVSFLVAPPVFWFRLANSDVDPKMFASVTATLSGAAPLSGSVAATLAERYGINLRQGYGLTEASPGLTSAVGTDAPPTSVGRPMPGVKLRLVDEFGDDVLIGDVGEVWANGPNVFAGYLGDPEATAAVIDEDGWLHTGDLAVVNEDGYLFIVGRTKDQIIVSGFNVHPGEVEDRLAEHHTVQAAAVIGEPDPEYGEVVVAHVVAARGMEPDPDVLEAHCRTQLAGYKVPKRFEFVDELPRGMTGKVRRGMLRD
jgi:long-chain acyl-CoA synthetase